MHLGIKKFMVLGYCIGQPFIWNLIKRAGDRVVALGRQPVDVAPREAGALVQREADVLLDPLLRLGALQRGEQCLLGVGASGSKHVTAKLLVSAGASSRSHRRLAVACSTWL